MFNAWLIHITLPTPAQIPDVEALNNVALEIERMAKDIAEANGVTKTPSINDINNENDYNGPIDMILLFFHYIDHCHEPTLRLFDKRIPVIASPEAKTIVEKMSHFDTVSLLPLLDGSASTWRSPDLHPDTLPPWLTAVKFLGHNELNFAAALVWTHDHEGVEIHETILEAPHSTQLDGDDAGPLHAFLAAEPPTQKLALLHRLSESWQVGAGTNVLGADAGLALYRKMGGAKYWLNTHSLELRYSGLIMRLLSVRRTPRTLDWALEREGVGKEGGGDRPNLVDLENGGQLVLV